MKKLSSLLCQVDRISPDKTVFSVFDNGLVKQFPDPMEAKDVKCPMCGGDDGFYIPAGRVWSCRNSDCISKNAKKYHYVSKIEITLKGVVPENYESCDISHVDSEILSSIKPFLISPKGFLLLQGDTGRGKTYTACCVAKEFLKLSPSVKFTTQESMNLVWLSAHAEGKVFKFFEYFSCPDLLIIDEIGIKAPSEAFLGFFLSVVNDRINSPRKATIFTTNSTAIEIAEQMGKAMLSRLCSGKIVKFEGKDRRLIDF